MYNNYVKIKCNPYTKHIEYYYKNESEEWVPVASKLSSDAFTNVTIQHKVHEIIQEINKVYNLGNKGLEIIFEGTKDDYIDICTELKEYFFNYKIHCCRGDLIIDSADSVMPTITSIFGSINETFREYPDDEISTELLKFNETIKPVVAICVMGLYSSGKSAFINSLIGNEVLPSASDPTTAKNYKITSSSESKIKFQYDRDIIELTFIGKKYSANKPGELNIIQELQEAIESDEKQTEFSHMYKALQIINGYDDEHGGEKHIATLIEVFVPFQNSKLPLGQFDFAIYDTPGSDSNHKEHLEVLKDSLQGQTNGLPIFITTPDEMDKEKNNEIIEIIEKMGEALDQTSTIVVVNKSDEKDSEVLDSKRKKGDELRITKWHSSRVFFVSSIMGLGSKKSNPLLKDGWTDKQYFKVFKQQYNSFSNPEDDFYMQLYRYNFLPHNRAEQILIEAERVNENQELLLLNSGIAAVEEEIAIFAHKYALYNKCVQARQYLDNAMEMVIKKTKLVEDDKRKIEEQIKKDIGEKKKELIDKLNDEGKKMAIKINVSYTEGIRRKVNDVYNSNVEAEKIEQAWENIKKRIKNGDERNKAIEKKVNDQYAMVYNLIRKSIENWSRIFWKRAEKKYKEKCCKIVSESSGLTEEEKKFLKDYVINSASIEVKEIKMNMRKENVIRERKFLFIRIGEKFDVYKCKEAFINSLKQSVLQMNSKAVSDNELQFRDWRKELGIGLKSKITSFNPLLKKLEGELNVCRQEIGRLNRQRNILNEKREILDRLLDFHQEV